MIIWIFALGLMAVLGLIGFYQGALRVAFSLVGLIVAALVCIPLALVIRPVLPVFGLTHPVLIAFIAPAIVYLLVLVAFKVSAVAVHKKATTHYKYDSSDTRRLLWERLNERLGICLGLANAAVYVFLVVTVAYVLGYFTIQVATSDKDSIWLKLANSVARDIQATGMHKAVAPFVPASAMYYDASDILGDIYRNPLLQSRLSSYPVFLTLAEKTEFKGIGNDATFQEFWQRGPAIGELISHPKVKPLVEDFGLYTNVVGMLGGNLTDLKEYLETGKSPKYDDEKILGRWDFDYADSLGRAKRAKPNMGSAELRWAKRVLGSLANANFTATIDQQAILKIPSTNSAAVTIKGGWQASSGGKYQLNLKEAAKALDVEASVEANKLVFSKDGFNLVFEK